MTLISKLRSLLVASVVLATVLLPIAGPSTASADGGNEFSVMTRNLYLGADVPAALRLFPDLSAVAQDLWTQVAATDFTARVGALSAEIVEQRPAVLGLQEATTWVCLDPAGRTVTVFDFTAQLLDELRSSGVAYEIAQAGGTRALSPGFEIAPIPGATVVRDPATLLPVVGADSAACGFKIADVLAVRSDLAGDVSAVGTKNFATTVKFGGLLEVKRGYAWADISFSGRPVHFVTTHLEATWTPDTEPVMAAQARELVADLQSVTMPVVAMGDFNADPRDPRASSAVNPGGQPEVTASCSSRSCNPYWIMSDAGYVDAGPDATDPRNLTWGADGLLAGPALSRLDAALALGNDLGFTDRLDYVFVRGDITVTSSSLVGREWPTGPATWECTTPAQVANTRAAAQRLGIAVPTTGQCFATDHLGIAATLSLPSSGGSGASPAWIIIGVVLAVLAIGTVVILLRRRPTRP